MRAPPAADSGSGLGKGKGRAEPAGVEEATRRVLGWTSTRVGAHRLEGSKGKQNQKYIGRRGRRATRDRTRERKSDDMHHEVRPNLCQITQ